MEHQRPVLHVVYAGYGDAFFLEYTINSTGKRILLVLDGGPSSVSPNPNDTRKAPYPQYFLSAARTIWKNLSTNTIFAPLAIINSHPDSDHFQGLLKMIARMSAEFQPGAPAHLDPLSEIDTEMFFNGPFLIPVVKKIGGEQLTQLSSLERLRAALAEKSFESDRPQDVAELKKSLPGLNIKYPPIQEIFRYWRGPDSAKKVKQIPEKDKQTQEIESGSFLVYNQRNVNEHHTQDIGTGDVDESPTNISSILLETDADVVGGRMCLTGDSVAWRIMQNCIGLDTNAPKPHYNIYKIQHHGSRKNNQLPDVEEGVGFSLDIEVKREFALRKLIETAFLSKKWPGIDVTSQDPIRQINDHEDVIFQRNGWVTNEQEKIRAGAEEAYAEIQKILEDVPSGKSGLASGDYIQLLRERHHTYLITCRDLVNLKEGKSGNMTVKPQKWEYNDAIAPWNVLKDVLTRMKDIAEKGKNAILKECDSDTVTVTAGGMNIEDKKLNFMTTEELNAQGSCGINNWYYMERRRSNHSINWDVKMYPYWCNFNTPKISKYWEWRYYLSILAVGSTRDFFSRFTADAYVVSANGLHNHPSDATILGLAAALKAMDRKATLFVTNAACIRLDNLRYLASVMFGCKLTEFIDTAAGGNLEIRFMDGPTYMSIDGGIQGNQEDRNRDLMKATRRINLKDTSIKTSLPEEPHQKLLDLQYETDKTALPDRSLSQGRYNIYTDIPRHGRWYFQFRNGHFPELSQKVPLQGVIVTESWERNSKRAHRRDPTFLELEVEIPRSQHESILWSLRSSTSRNRDGGYNIHIKAASTTYQGYHNRLEDEPYFKSIRKEESSDIPISVKFERTELTKFPMNGHGSKALRGSIGTLDSNIVASNFAIFPGMMQAEGFIQSHVSPSLDNSAGPTGIGSDHGTGTATAGAGARHISGRGIAPISNSRSASLGFAGLRSSGAVVTEPSATASASQLQGSTGEVVTQHQVNPPIFSEGSQDEKKLDTSHIKITLSEFLEKNGLAICKAPFFGNDVLLAILGPNNLENLSMTKCI